MSRSHDLVLKIYQPIYTNQNQSKNKSMGITNYEAFLIRHKVHTNIDIDFITV